MSLDGLATSMIQERDAPSVLDGSVAVGVAEGPGLAHDAGNLLGALRLYSDLLAMPGVLHEEHKEYARDLKMLSERSWAMIDRLMNHAGASRSAKAQSECVALPDVLDQCRGILSRVAGRTVKISYDSGAFQPVRVPVESVERILTNLVKNAAEATPRAGEISIHVEGVVEQSGSGDDGPRRRVMMTVRDRGCGMDQTAVFRLIKAGGMSSASGRGIGFRVVRELVADSGGVLTIESEPGVGTSILTEWRVVGPVQTSEEELKMEGAGMTDLGAKTVLRGEAGWIAC